ncbi:MAG TPA: YidC/Oxa1 family insertase periplasmic-domain containing protein [Planctomycetia bacterium]|nr:YidC/Oxa1 family insertase periplasmic-domain containing protein [Planctomycetia bacterium]
MFGWARYQESQMLAVKKRRAEELAKLEAEKPKVPEKGKEAGKDDPKAGKGGTGEVKAGKADDKDPKGKAPQIAAAKPAPPEKVVTLGVDADAGEYRLAATLSSRGAVVRKLELLPDADGLLKKRFPLLEGGADSFRLDLAGESLSEAPWEYVEAASKPPEKAVFRTIAREGTVEITKTFTLPKDSFLVELTLDFKNLSDKPIDDLVYKLTGGENLPLEGHWYTQYYRRLVTLLVPPGRAATLDEQLGIDLVTKGHGGILEAAPAKFAGTSVQYFASVVAQEPPISETRYWRSVEPRPAKSAPSDPKRKDGRLAENAYGNVSFVATSEPVRLEPKTEAQHKYALFNGPKKDELFAAEPYAKYDLPQLVTYTGFLYLRFDWLSNRMVWLLDRLYRIVGDYGLAIICLTILVRLCLFPLTFRQTRAMVKMQTKMAIIQPKLEELKRKYPNDQKKMQQEMMEIYRQHDANPFAMLGGCLPLFLQMPIFIALYQGLQSSFDLRLAPMKFTWITDLSAPDRLFKFPFELPILGPYFNLLPVLSMIQMILTMRMMSPPAMSPEQAEQQKMTMKMMTFMMIFMGFAFYKVPAGLCVYIIVSSSWALLERQFLPKPPKPKAPAEGTAGGDGKTGSPAIANATSWRTPLKDKKVKR